MSNQSSGLQVAQASCGCLILLVAVPLCIFLVAVLFGLITGAGAPV